MLAADFRIEVKSKKGNAGTQVLNHSSLEKEYVMGAPSLHSCLELV